MGDIISGVIGGIGSLFGGNKQQKADAQGAQQSLEGFNYLTGKNGVGGYVGAGNQANDQAMGLLTGNNPSAMSNYLKSTGFNFQRDQGTAAITGSAAARGMLNSGATAKALTKFGTGLAGQSFDNYLGQLGGVAGRGLAAGSMIGQAGTTGGANAAALTKAGGQAAAGQIGDLAGSAQKIFSSPTVTNFLGF